jgi:hypothetical protein
MESNVQFQRVCAWSGVICVVLFFGAFVAADFIPPLSPDLDAAETARHYQEHTLGVRFGACLMLLSPMFYVAYTSVVSSQMRRIPGLNRVVTYLQLAAGSFACLTFLVPAMLFLVTAFRAERPVEDTQLLSDLSWLLLVIAWQPFMPQMIAFAYAILTDRRPRPLFPRWLAYLNLWIAFMFTPATCLAFFKTGPLAWNGVFGFWIPAAVFIIMFAANTAMLLRAIASDDRDTDTGSPGRQAVAAA